MKSKIYHYSSLPVYHRHQGHLGLVPLCNLILPRPIYHQFVQTAKKTMFSNISFKVFAAENYKQFLILPHSLFETQLNSCNFIYIYWGFSIFGYKLSIADMLYVVKLKGFQTLQVLLSENILWKLCSINRIWNMIFILFYWGFTPFSTFFQLYHGNSSLIHDPWVNKPVLV